jgi:GntR family transcriptional repressor for pyruvate dehydrogenase complex
LSSQVAEHLRAEIVRRKLTAGDRLPSERQLGEQFGVSRTVIREAVRMLAAEGLVTARSGKGLEVTTVDASVVVESMRMFIHGQPELDYAKLHDVRSVFELAAVERAAALCDHDAVGRMENLCTQMSEALPDIERASRLDFLFHREIAIATGNPFFEVFLDALGPALMEVRRTTFAYDADRIARVVEDHRSIVAAIAAGAPVEAKARMADHLDDVRATWALTQ